ncbi:uncharacterized protein LOC108489576 [Gossypium arboreum]|uniref:Uncharacterized protein n=1 Tax=Gossypium arboreum TaxID=29729 RepID=A0ABR0QJ20_GOSAR|nr:uncharacterized protein LOC108489576 [Gossypium arboreum]KAK5838982.1 hypothetical protein PVK06_007733 [Gossypium arboreum]
MESTQDIELINQEIQKLLEGTTVKDISENDNDHLLSRLFCQLESLKENNTLKQSEVEELNFPRAKDDKAEAKSENGSGRGGMGVEELVKELKAIKKQNTITHGLLLVMIVVTLFWQVSEASLLLQVKNGLTHPFKSVGSWLVTLLKGRAKPTQQHCNHLVDASASPPSLQLPEFPHLGSSGDGH